MLIPQNRTVDGAVDEICRLLKWAGIEWDEGRNSEKINAETDVSKVPELVEFKGPISRYLEIIHH